MLSKIEAIDLIALVVIVGGLILKFTGADGTVGTLLTTVVLFYFGKKEVYDKIVARKESAGKVESAGEQIRRIAIEEKVDPELAYKVAKCESSLNPHARGINAAGSEDRGVFQWNSKYHPEIDDDCAFDVECATRAFCKAVKEGHLSWWNASKECWSK